MSEDFKYKNLLKGKDKESFNEVMNWLSENLDDNIVLVVTKDNNWFYCETHDRPFYVYCKECAHD